MSKLIRRTKKNFGAALLVALQITTLTLVSLMLVFASGPSAPSAPSAPPAGAIPAVKLYEPRATEVFNLATSRAESAQQSTQQSSLLSETTTEATLTTNLDDYPPYSYVYISGTGFEPGETVNMIVVQLSPNPASYEPWDVVADENGNIETTWYVFSDELIGATMQVTATGQTSNLTASATFTDNAAPVLYQDLARTIRRDSFAWGDTVYLKGNLNGVSLNRCYKVDWVDPFVPSFRARTLSRQRWTRCHHLSLLQLQVVFGRFACTRQMRMACAVAPVSRPIPVRQSKL